MKAIIYNSQSGYTKQYAELLSEEIGLPAYDIADAQDNVEGGEPIIFMTWIKTGDIMAYSRVKRKYDLQAIALVGIHKDGEPQLKRVRRRQRVVTPNLFYLRGGIDRRKMRSLERKMVDMMKSDLEKSIAKKNKKNQPVPEDDRETLNGLENKSNFVEKENLEEIINWYNEANS